MTKGDTKAERAEMLARLHRGERGEKPRWRVEQVRILEGADLAQLLEHADADCALFEFLG